MVSVGGSSTECVALWVAKMRLRMVEEAVAGVAKGCRALVQAILCGNVPNQNSAIGSFDDVDAGAKGPRAGEAARRRVQPRTQQQDKYELNWNASASNARQRAQSRHMTAPRVQ